jgi:hypothetical protein
MSGVRGPLQLWDSSPACKAARALEEKAAQRGRGGGVVTLLAEGESRPSGEAAEKEECGGARLWPSSMTCTRGRSGASDGEMKECGGQQHGRRQRCGEGRWRDDPTSAW